MLLYKVDDSTRFSKNIIFRDEVNEGHLQNTLLFDIAASSVNSAETDHFNRGAQLCRSVVACPHLNICQDKITTPSSAFI
jgi:hypothetical protein